MQIKIWNDYEDTRQKSPQEMVGLRRWRYPCNDSAVVRNKPLHLLTDLVYLRDNF